MTALSRNNTGIAAASAALDTTPIAGNVVITSTIGTRSVKNFDGGSLTNSHMKREQSHPKSVLHHH